MIQAIGNMAANTLEKIRFFYKKDYQTISAKVLPICGYIGNIMKVILDELYHQLFLQKLSNQWWELLLIRKDVNNSMKGYAYKDFAIANILKNPESMIAELEGVLGKDIKVEH